VNLDDDTYSESRELLNLVLDTPPIILDELGDYGLDIFKNINDLLSKKEEELTRLQKSIVTAIYWFGNAVKEKERRMKFVKIIMALETILIPDGGKEKRNKISKRFVSIIYNYSSDEEKYKIYLDVRVLYGIRNSIIHSGIGYVYDDDLVQIRYWTQSLIQFVLKYIDKYHTIEELINNEFPINEHLYSSS